MKKQTKLNGAVLLLLLTLSFTFNGCKKDARVENKQSDAVEVQKAKSWYEAQQKEMTAGMISSSMKYIKVTFEPQWDNAAVEMIDGKAVIAMELKTNLQNIVGKSTTYNLLITKSGDDYVSKMVGVKGEKLSVSELYATAFTEKNIAQNKAIDAKVNIYDIQGRDFKTITYRANARIPELTKPSSDIKTQSVEECIDWYLIFDYYIDGILVGRDIIYIGRTCPQSDQPQDPNGGGGGGGGSSSTTESINMSSSTEFTKTGTGLAANFGWGNATERTYTYNWEVGKNTAFGWSVRSYETGTHTKVGTQWHWQNLVHNNLLVLNKPSWLSVVVTETEALPSWDTMTGGMAIKCNVAAIASYNGHTVSTPAQDITVNSPLLNSNLP